MTDDRHADLSDDVSYGALAKGEALLGDRTTAIRLAKFDLSAIARPLKANMLTSLATPQA
jgi:hypothetical protein